VFKVCATTIGKEVQVYFYERGFSFSARARTVWEEVNGELRRAFGAEAVRSCRFARRPDPEPGESAGLRQVCIPTE
jgi:hypothetical protein